MSLSVHEIDDLVFAVGPTLLLAAHVFLRH